MWVWVQSGLSTTIHGVGDWEAGGVSWGCLLVLISCEQKCHVHSSAPLEAYAALPGLPPPLACRLQSTAHSTASWLYHGRQPFPCTLNSQHVWPGCRGVSLPSIDFHLLQDTSTSTNTCLSLHRKGREGCQGGVLYDGFASLPLSALPHSGISSG